MTKLSKHAGEIHPLLYPILVPLLVAVVGTLLLLMETLIPQDWVRNKTLVSAEELMQEGKYRWFFFQALPPAEADNPTEEFMIETSFNMDSVNDVFLKPIASNPYDDDQYFQGLYDLASGTEYPTWNYPRYWMGFRIFLRPLLCFFALNKIRLLYAVCFFLLFVGMIASLTDKKRVPAAFAYACSCAMVEPHSFAFSIKCVCCFLLMTLFGIVLIHLKARIRERRTLALFCLFGALTQFFDFYDNPLLTCVVPLLILVCLEEDSVKACFPAMLKLILAWLASYVSMWLIGSLFVTLFTPENGFAGSFVAAYGRLGIGQYKDERYSYSPILALQTVTYWSLIRIFGHEVPLSMLWLAIVPTGILAVAARLCSKSWGRIPAYLFIGLLPILWIAVTAQPTIIHKTLQYRIVCGLYFAWFLLLIEAVSLILQSRKRRA